MAAAEQNFWVVQTAGSFRNEIGEMSEMEVYAHVRMRLGNDMTAAERVLGELEEKGTATARFKGTIRFLGRRTALRVCNSISLIGMVLTAKFRHSGRCGAVLAVGSWPGLAFHPQK